VKYLSDGKNKENEKENKKNHKTKRNNGKEKLFIQTSSLGVIYGIKC
jgi:hypothetical protein